MILFFCLSSCVSSTSAVAARWHATVAPSASRGTGPPTRSNVVSASGCWPWSRSPSDDHPSSLPWRRWGSIGEGGGQSWSANWGEHADKTLTEDNVGCLSDGFRGGDKDGEEKNKAKRHLPLPRTSDSPSLAFHVDDGERYYFIFIFIFRSFSRRETLELPAAMIFVCEGGKSCLVDELDKLLWTTV